jgi:hypothetical protein
LNVIITDAVVKSAFANKDFIKLHKLISYAADSNRHFLSFESKSASEEVIATFSEEVQGIYRTLLEQSARDAVRFSSNRITIKIDDVVTSDWQLSVPVVTLEDSLKLLNEKIAILLENATNDWNFLLSIMLPMDRRLIQSYVSEGGVSVLHGGGTTLGEQLKQRTDEPWKCFRTFVLFDSDRLHPDEFHSDWTTERPNKNSVSCHAYEWEKQAKRYMPNRYWMLQRRFIESYMPRNELRIGKNKDINEEAINIFFSMSQSERWYYNMKGGFSAESNRDDCERSRNLYIDLSDEHKAFLNKGFGKGLGKHYSKFIEREFVWDDEARAEADAALPKLLRML